MEVAEVDALGGKKVTGSLVRHECLRLLFFVFCFLCVGVVINQVLEMVCVEHAVCTCNRWRC